MRSWLGCIIVLLSSFCMAEDWSVIARAAKMSQTQSFSGTYVRQLGDGLQTFLIYRTNARGQVVERRIATDGVSREVMRSNRHLRFFAKDEHAIEQARLDGFRLFPVVLPEDTGAVSQSYLLQKGNKDRVAGRACQWYHLQPKDKQRYSQQYCLDSSNFMPLKMLILQPNLHIVEQNSFAQIQYESPTKQQMIPNHELIMQQNSRLPPSYAITTRLGKGVHRSDSGHFEQAITDLPQGFRVLAARQVKMPQNEQTSMHYIIGDGLITVSLFVEPHKQVKANEAHVVNGALVMARVYKDKLRFTAIGDMPASGLALLLQNLKLNEMPN